MMRDFEWGKDDISSVGIFLCITDTLEDLNALRKLQ